MVRVDYVLWKRFPSSKTYVSSTVSLNECIARARDKLELLRGADFTCAA